ncbi:Uma2 family endonuclease [Streptomyces harbinensis]|uniref:Uma2 family endonuclease n=1 Tax=Streptomyces harbinensis TaxID=1176198 RepID=UPI0034DF9502
MEYERIREVAARLGEIPEAAKVEISDGSIIMMMSPSGTHELIAMRVARQLNQQLDGDLVAHTGGDVEHPGLGILRRPDVVVLPESAMDTPGSWEASLLELVGEVVSPSNFANDYQQKLRDYPAMGIPLYLLIDPRTAVISVLSDPGPGPDGPRYRARHDYTFGDKVSVGRWHLDSRELPRYRQ